MLLLGHCFSISIAFPFAMYIIIICYAWSGFQPGLNLVVVVVELSALSGNLYERA